MELILCTISIVKLIVVAFQFSKTFQQPKKTWRGLRQRMFVSKQRYVKYYFLIKINQFTCFRNFYKSYLYHF